MISGYGIKSASSSLDTSNWDPVSTGTPVPGFPQGNGSGNGWEMAPNPSGKEVVEWYLTGSSTIAAGGSVSVGNAYFPTIAVGDYNNDTNVDLADYIVWREMNGTPRTFAE